MQSMHARAYMHSAPYGMRPTFPAMTIHPQSSCIHPFSFSFFLPPPLHFSYYLFAYLFCLKYVQLIENDKHALQLRCCYCNTHDGVV
mmetsp:Transcript_20695/g.53395  ORF Transcript_20695/g.53395 Transcript_20695/m.53395 type:complete len:87 (-) Transcript_20695:358-618(-)